MRKFAFATVVGVALGAILGSGAFAQQAAEVTVEASRIVSERVGRSPTGAPISALSLAYTVSYADLDLSTKAGVDTLEDRVSDAAKEACREISRLYPTATPSDSECVQRAVKGAMSKVKVAADAAAK